MKAELDESLFEQIIQDHAHRRVGAVRDADLTNIADTSDSASVLAGTSTQYNPVCGDRLTLHAVLADDHIASIRWHGQGCVLSQVSASMVADRFENQTLESFRIAADHLRAVLRDPDASRPDEALLGDAIALSGAARLPSRIKCVMLAWVALEEAADVATSTAAWPDA